MFNAELFSSSTRKYAAVLIPLWLVLAVSVFAQSDLRDVVYGKPKNSTKTKPKTTTPAKSKTTRAIPPPKPTPIAVVKKTQPRSNPTPKNSVKTLLPVTFRAKEASVEVWLNDKNIGQTDTNFQFSKKLAPGEYRLVAKNKKQVLFSQKITVSAEQTRFDLFDREPPVLQVVQTKAETEEPKEKTEEEKAKEASEKVKQIIETYENPATTDTVTTDDWQFVLQSAEAGKFQGNTQVQIDAQKWFASGQIELGKRDYTNAFTAFGKAREILPTWAFPYYEIGNTHFAGNQLLEAIKSYQTALQKNNKLGMVYKRLGDAQRFLSKDKEALSAYEQAIQFGYRTFDTRYQIALLRIENREKSQVDKGIEELEALAGEMPKAELFIKIGEAYEKQKKELNAFENYKKAISLDPNSAQAHNRIGGMFFNQKDYPKAKESLEKAIALDPGGRVLDIKEAQKKLREIATKSNR